VKSATISELKNQLSKFLRFVKQGEVVVILDRGVPVAEIQPRQPGSSKATKDEERLNRLEAKGIIRRGNPQKLKKFPYPPDNGHTGVLEALLEERRSGR
jgi:prevent-host-death family protein